MSKIRKYFGQSYQKLIEDFQKAKQDISLEWQKSSAEFTKAK